MEVIFANNRRKVVLRYALAGSGHGLELREADWVVDALFEEVEFGFADSHLAVESKEAFSGVVEGFEADRFESEVLGVTPQHVKRLLFAFLGVLGIHVVGVASSFEADNLLSAFVKIGVEKDEILERGHVVNFV